ncbi:DUF2341 domain-containing protein [Methylomicrobium lacus]|uniref:DUF2341 domain-containing protein n=1 Tax=Methylomicrobium lacus TaxID=136992 RepID=UPI0035A81A2D
MKKFGVLFLLLVLAPSMASAWWNEDWAYKKKITLDMQKLQQDGVTVPASAFALIRLHMGNFGFFADLADKGKDVRVLAGDEKTPLKFFIEKLDTVNQMALIWVKLPADIATAEEPAVWLYYGNQNATDAQDAGGAFDANQVLDYAFDRAGTKDATAYGNNPSESSATAVEGGLIADAAVFNGSQIVRVPATPALQMSTVSGWTVSAWVKIDQAQNNSVIFQRSGPGSTVTLSILGETPYAEVEAGSKQEIKGPVPLTKGTWHHLALSAETANLVLYVDGVSVGSLGVETRDLTGELTLGADAKGARGFTGMLDQLAVFKTVRDANAIKFDFAMQGSAGAVLAYGEDSTPDSEEGGENLIMGSIKNVTTDGWVIIGILGVMFVISWMVMIVKAIVLNRISRENKRFGQAYSQLTTQEIGNLNSEDDEDDQDYDESALLLSFTKSHGAFTGSSIYRVYHVGVEEMNRRLKKGTRVKDSEPRLTSQSMEAVKATMDAALIRELQKLNSQMVLLTIAISGGPFLGLLGTVIGVMITFAAIAVSGEVNVNAIAPGIAGALTATVAGLAVAIPCLFGYNYLGSRIKEITADMQVFVDEFVAKLAEQHT